MNIDLARGIVDGKPLKEWWEHAPFGAFQSRCRELGIKLEFGDSKKGPKVYEVEARYSFSGSGYVTIEVEAESEEEARSLAIAEFSIADVDNFSADVNEAEIDYIKEVRCPEDEP